MANWGSSFLDSFNKAQDRSLQIAQSAAELKFKKWLGENEGKADLAKKGIIPAPTDSSGWAEMMGRGDTPMTMYGQQFQIPKNTLGVKPVFTIGDNGQLESLGNVPKGSQVVPPSSMMTPQAKSELDIQTALKKSELPTADMKNALKTTQQAGSLVDNLIDQSSKLKGGYEGMAEIGKAALNRGKGDSANYRLYLSNMPSTAVSIYRAVTGDTRLSDMDAQARAYPLMWHPSEDVDTRDKKNAFIKNMVTARQVLLKSNKFTSDDKGNAITDLGTVSAMAKKIAAAKEAGYSQKQIEEFLGAK